MDICIRNLASFLF